MTWKSLKSKKIRGLYESLKIKYFQLPFFKTKQKMKVPKQTKRYCPYCNKRTEQKIDLLSTGGKRATLKRGSKERAKKRGMTGKGSLGKYSKPAIKSWKRKTKTTTKKVLIYTCKECKKSLHSKKGRRVSRMIVGEKG